MFIPLTVGGGVREVNDVRRLLNAGADKVSINTAAVQNPRLVEDAAGRFGSQCIVVAVDAKRCRTDELRWEVFTHGGRRPTGLDAVEWGRRMQAAGAGEILLTSMDRDGTRAGFDVELTCAFSEALDIPVIASGGVGSLQHLVDGISYGKADAVLAASVFHYGEFTVRQAKQYMADTTSRCGCERCLAGRSGLGRAGLVPAIAQEAATGKLLMMAWMNREALAETVRTRPGGILVALTQQAVAKGRGIGTRPACPGNPARL